MSGNRFYENANEENAHKATAVTMDMGEQGYQQQEGQRQAGQKIVSTTCVYVECLPLNTTVEEVAREFAPCGELASDDSGNPRIKLYKYRDGSLKGDGLVNYVEPEGAERAIADMDGRPLRMYGDDDEDEDAMIVTMAFFEQKERKQRHQFSPRASARNGSQREQNYHDNREWRDPANQVQQVPMERQENKQPFDDSFYDLPSQQNKGKNKGKPKATVDEDGWETVGPAPLAEDEVKEEAPPIVPTPSVTPEAPKPKTYKTAKHSASVISFDGSVHKAWGDDSSDEDEEEEECWDEEPQAIEDIEGIDDMTADIDLGSDSEDEDVKEKRKQDALAAKEQGAQKQKSKKPQLKQSMSKKEMKELKQKEDEEFDRLLNQAVEEAKIATAKEGAESETPVATPPLSESESVTPPEPSEPVVLDKAALQKAAKNKKRKEMAKKKKEEEAGRKKAEESAKESDLGDTATKSKAKIALTPSEVLAMKREKKAKKDAKAAKEKVEINAKKMALQKKAKEQRAKQSANFQQNIREKFHFSSENSTGCDAG